MILILDANVIVSDAELSGKVWPELSQAVEDQVLRVFVPSIVVAEVTSTVRAARRKSAPQMPNRAPEPVRAAIVASTEAIWKWAEEYDAASTLEAAGFEILPSPTVSHDVVAQRAIERIRPFNDSGGGYRDTLHWFSLLEIAKANPNEEIVFVSNDRLFASDGQLHDSLVAEAMTELGGRSVDLHSKIVTVPIPGKFASDSVSLALDGDGLGELLDALFPSGKLHVTDLWVSAGLLMAEDAELREPIDIQVLSGSERPLVAGGAQRTIEMTLSAKVDFDWSESADWQQDRERVRLLVRYTVDDAGSPTAIDAVESAIAWQQPSATVFERSSSHVGFNRVSFDMTEQLKKAINEAQPKLDLSGLQKIFPSSATLLKPIVDAVGWGTPKWTDLFDMNTVVRHLLPLANSDGFVSPLTPEARQALSEVTAAMGRLAAADVAEQGERSIHAHEDVGLPPTDDEPITAADGEDADDLPDVSPQ